MQSYRERRRPPQKQFHVGNNRALTEARKKQRLGTFGTILPKRIVHFFQMIASTINDYRANAKERSLQLKSFVEVGDMKEAIRQLRLLHKNRMWNKATERMNIWDEVKQELLEQSDRAIFGHTKKAVAQLISESGYDARYSGKRKQMFVAVNNVSNDEGIPQLHEVISMVKERFSDLPFGIRAGNY